MNQVAIDNDVLYKGACYGLLTDLVQVLPFPQCTYGVLGAAQYMLPKRLRNRPPKQGSAAAIKELQRFLKNTIPLEPDSAEVGFAAKLERNALMRGMQLDAGESLLCVLVISRTYLALVTGDKRAIKAIATLLASEPRIAGRVFCLEHLFLLLLISGGGSKARAAVCANPDIDIALSNCFACNSPEVPEAHWQEGLESYLKDIRSTGGNILAAF